jgi:hypothetical protein
MPNSSRHGLHLYRGHPVLITWFYGRCPMACPALIDTVRAVERAADPQQRTNMRVLLVSIDPEHDTPQAQRTLAETRRIDLSRWTLAHADEATVRKLAAVLNVQYRRLPDGQYNHASVISVLRRKARSVDKAQCLAGQVNVCSQHCGKERHCRPHQRSEPRRGSRIRDCASLSIDTVCGKAFGPHVRACMKAELVQLFAPHPTS